MTEYLNLKTTTVYNDPLRFWYEVKSKFPILSNVARSIFAIPASSAEPERHCSSAGLTLTDLRSSITTGNLEDIVLLKEHMKNI